ncbi:SDR family NAD(P)-dependent oxidoreductase [Pararhizobium mangrovi]|nr:SDR family NAD(P)-dependent oxidoreductase [Pararhizobium mangrovi]
METLGSFPSGGLALVIGAGGIGSAVRKELAGSGRFAEVLVAGRRENLAFDLLDEASIAALAKTVGERKEDLRLVFDATGYLYDDEHGPEKSWRHVTPEAIARAFALNATGPMLLMKHLLPLLPRRGKAVFATLSAKVGSIGDNHIGGWYGYRASKAALNQFVRTAAVELARTHGEAACVALHPGTVDTPLSKPFAKDGLTVRSPEEAARKLVRCLEGIGADHSGLFLDRSGETLPW